MSSDISRVLLDVAHVSAYPKVNSGTAVRRVESRDISPTVKIAKKKQFRFSFLISPAQQIIVAAIFCKRDAINKPKKQYRISEASEATVKRPNKSDGKSLSEKAKKL